MRLVAGRGFAVELHREDTAGRGRCSEEPSGRCCWPGAAAERLVGRGAVAEAAGRGTVAKKLATPWQRAIGKKLLTRNAAVAKMLLTGASGARYLIQQSCHVQKAFLQKSNC